MTGWADVFQWVVVGNRNKRTVLEDQVTHDAKGNLVASLSSMSHFTTSKMPQYQDTVLHVPTKKEPCNSAVIKCFLSPQRLLQAQRWDQGGKSGHLGEYEMRYFQGKRKRTRSTRGGNGFFLQSFLPSLPPSSLNACGLTVLITQ